MAAKLRICIPTDARPKIDLSIGNFLVSSDPNGYYLIKNKLTGGCIEARPEKSHNRVGNEVSVQQCDRSGFSRQWKS